VTATKDGPKGILPKKIPIRTEVGHLIGLGEGDARTRKIRESGTGRQSRNPRSGRVTDESRTIFFGSNPLHLDDTSSSCRKDPGWYKGRPRGTKGSKETDEMLDRVRIDMSGPREERVAEKQEEGRAPRE